MYMLLLFLEKIYVILLKDIVLEVLLNRFFNSLGKVGEDIFLDLWMEYLNKLLKFVIK